MTKLIHGSDIRIEPHPDGSAVARFYFADSDPLMRMAATRIVIRGGDRDSGSRIDCVARSSTGADR